MATVIPEEECDRCPRSAEWEIMSPDDDDFRSVACLDHLAIQVSETGFDTYGLYKIEYEE